jgi:tetratricopeptide (TPR) repeat protein
LLSTVGNAINALGEPEQARPYFEEARDLAIELGDESIVASALNNLALTLLATGKTAEARVALTQVLDIARRHRNPAVVTLSSMNLALVEVVDGHPASAYPYARGAVTGARRGGDAPMTAYGLLACALSVEDPALATTLHAAAARLLKDQDETFERLEAQLRDAHLERLRTELGADAFDAAEAAGRALSAEDAVALLPEVTAP